MKYRINEIKFKDKTAYEPQVCKKVKTKIPTGEWELVDTWDRIVGKRSIVTNETYYDMLPTAIEEAERIIEIYHEEVQRLLKEPIIKTIKEYELPKKEQDPEEKQQQELSREERIEKLEALAKLAAWHIGKRPTKTWEEAAAMMLYDLRLWPLTVDEVVEQTRTHIENYSKVTAMMDAAGGSKAFWEAKHREGKKK